MNQDLNRCPNIDMIVRGEGEDIIKQIAARVPSSEIRGFSYRENEGIVHNEIHPLPGIMKIALSDRSLKKHDYHMVKFGVQISSHTFNRVLTTGGCPFNARNE